VGDLDSSLPELHLTCMRFRLRALASPVLLSTAAACGTDPSDLGRCSGPLQLTIFRSPVVEFRWGPSGCTVYSLSIDKGTEGGWYVESLEFSNQIESPVRYGVTPSGTQASPAESLHGGPYRLMITRLDGSGGAPVVADTLFNAP
jgi:hypothetical protein